MGININPYNKRVDRIYIIGSKGCVETNVLPDSVRTDVDYERYRDHLLDRKMLELLKKY